MQASDCLYDRLVEEHTVLLHEFGSVQRRCSDLLVAQAREIEALQAQNMQLRAQVIARDSALAYAKADRAALEARILGLRRRVALARHVESLVERVQTLTREKMGWQWWGSAAPAAPTVSTASSPSAARKRAVLCIVPDTADAMQARALVETAGGEFLHHDGNDAPDSQTLEASLQAADLVICQTGCVSHDAYWRAHDHCRRTGKQCVLVEQPQVLHVVRSASLNLEPV